MKHHLYEPSVLLPWSICHRLSQPVCPWQACLPGRPPPCTAAAAACAFSVRFSDLWQLDVQPSDSPYYTLQGCGKRGEFYKLPTDMSRPKAAPPSLLHPKVQKKLKSLVSIWISNDWLIGLCWEFKTVFTKVFKYSLFWVEKYSLDFQISIDFEPSALQDSIKSHHIQQLNEITFSICNKSQIRIH